MHVRAEWELETVESIYILNALGHVIIMHNGHTLHI